MNKWLYVILLLVFSNSSHAGLFDWFGADSYYECILDSMPGEMNQRQVTKIRQDCAREHPDIEPVEKIRPFFAPHNTGQCLKKYASNYQQAGIIWIREACIKLYYVQ